MTPDDFALMDVSRYELRLRARQAVTLPPFLGSTLRGAFGHALKEAVCVMNHRDCARCMVADRCIYPYLFETPVPADLPQLRGQQQAPHPFILAPPPFDMPRIQRGDNRLSSGGRRRLAAGDEMIFGLLLMGRAIEYLPYIVYAVSEMARHGLGADRAAFELTEVAMLDESGGAEKIYSGKEQRIAVPDRAAKSLSGVVRARLERMSGLNGLKLRFLTPTRIRVEGDLQMGLSFEQLVRNLLRRVSLLIAVHGRAQLELDYRGLIALAAGVKTRMSTLQWCDWERYSNRQKTKMKLGGFMGEVEYAGDAIREFLPLVAAGEILHVGAGTSFGLGKYQIV